MLVWVRFSNKKLRVIPESYVDLRIGTFVMFCCYNLLGFVVNNIFQIMYGYCDCRRLNLIHRTLYEIVEKDNVIPPAIFRQKCSSTKGFYSGHKLQQ